MTKSSYQRLARIREAAARRTTRVDQLNELTEPYGVTLHPTKGWRIHAGARRDIVIQITEMRKRGLFGNSAECAAMLKGV